MSKYDEFYGYQEQSSVQNILVSGESILWQGKPKKSAFVINKCLTMAPFALLWLILDGGVLGMMFSTGQITRMAWFIIPFFALHLMPVWIWLGNVLSASKRWKNTEYALTDRRIILLSGFIGRDYQSVYYKDIYHVQLKEGAIDRLLHVGDIYFDLGGKNRQAFLDIENAYEIYPMIQKTVMDIQTDIEFPNNLRPDYNDGYQTKYRMKQ